jgi:uncharacterized protein Yka (UPF0111/DUF47 family)
MFSLKPKEEKFFILFRENAGVIKEGSHLMQDMMSCYNCFKYRLDKVVSLHNDGEKVFETIIRRLDESFITPFDREDIYSLARGMDEILDAIYSCVDKMVLFKIGKPLDEFGCMVTAFGRNAEIISEAVLLLNNVKLNYNEIMEKCETIKKNENDGDHLYRKGVSKLFETEMPPLEVIKWMEVYREAEKALDRSERMSKTIQGLVLKYA